MNENQIREILEQSSIFKNCWENPHPAARKYQFPKKGIGKGKAFTEMALEIKEVLPKAESILNIGIGFGKGMNNETIKWLDVYDRIFGPFDRFTNVELLESSINSMMHVVKQGNITGRARQFFSNNIVGDVRDILVDDIGTYDMLLWSHGPEHIYRNEWKDTFDNLKKIAKIICIHLPWGTGYNDEPTHYSPSVRRGELEKFGFSVRYVGVEDTKMANMYGWMRGDV